MEKQERKIIDSGLILKFSFIIVSIILVLPSVKYLFTYKTIANFSLFNTWILEKMEVGNKTLIDAICFVGLFLILTFIYINIIKKDVFKKVKEIIIFLIIVSVIFGIAIPYMTSDIFYYLGIGWLDSNYHENPYYSTVYNKMQEIQNDEILNSTGYWSKTTCVYGPLWQLISKGISTLSFGSVTIGIYMYKFIAIIIHVLNAMLIYKICKKKSFMLLYGLNPMVLFHMITNVHNDIYVVFLLLLSIYFIKRKKNIWLSLIALGLSVAIKYFTILFFPFLVLYWTKNEKIYKKFLYGLGYFLFMLSIISIPYLFYVRDINILKAMLVQGDKYSQSIWCLLLVENRMHGWNINIDGCKMMGYIIFIAIYFCLLIKNLLTKDLKWKNIVRDYELTICIFIFLVLATFQVWYLVWLLPVIMWQKKENIMFYNNLFLISIIPLGTFIYRQSDGYIYGMWQSMMILFLAVLVKLINIIDCNLKRKKIQTKKEG